MLVKENQASYRCLRVSVKFTSKGKWLYLENCKYLRCMLSSLNLIEKLIQAHQLASLRVFI